MMLAMMWWCWISLASLKSRLQNYVVEKKAQRGRNQSVDKWLLSAFQLNEKSVFCLMFSHLLFSYLLSITYHDVLAFEYSSDKIQFRVNKTPMVLLD